MLFAVIKLAFKKERNVALSIAKPICQRAAGTHLLGLNSPRTFRVSALQTAELSLAEMSAKLDGIAWQIYQPYGLQYHRNSRLKFKNVGNWFTVIEQRWVDLTRFVSRKVQKFLQTRSSRRNVLEVPPVVDHQDHLLLAIFSLPLFPFKHLISQQRIQLWPICDQFG